MVARANRLASGERAGGEWLGRSGRRSGAAQIQRERCLRSRGHIIRRCELRHFDAAAVQVAPGAGESVLQPQTAPAVGAPGVRRRSAPRAPTPLGVAPTVIWRPPPQGAVFYACHCFASPRDPGPIFLGAPGRGGAGVDARWARRRTHPECILMGSLFIDQPATSLNLSPFYLSLPLPIPYVHAWHTFMHVLSQLAESFEHAGSAKRSQKVTWPPGRAATLARCRLIKSLPN